MTREQLEHLIRAAGAITNGSRFVVIGSQAILGQFPNARGDLTKSIEADLIDLDCPENWNQVDGVLGEGSSFHETFGYHAQGVDLTTAILPIGWEDRLIRIDNPNTRGTAGLCLEVYDLAASKLTAGREKDSDFVRALFEQRLVRVDELLARVALLPIAKDRLALVLQKIQALSETSGLDQS